MNEFFSWIENIIDGIIHFILGYKDETKAEIKDANVAELPRLKIPPKTDFESPRNLHNRIIALTKPKFWIWETFREIIILLGNPGEERYLPAFHIPKFIFIDGLLPVIDDLIRISKANHGVETSRAVFVDSDRSCLVQSGKTRLGTMTSVLLDVSAEKGRESFQTPVMAIHLHPRLSGSEVFSDNDYLAFLADPRLFVMVISNSQEVVFAFKTTATREKIDVDETRKHIASSQKDIIEIWKKLNLPMPELAFNKAICTEYGLVLFKLDNARHNLARHISVIME